MAEYIFDNPETLCRELTETFSNGKTAAVCMISIPKSAIDNRLSVFPRAWGSYANKFNLSKKSNFTMKTSGTKRGPEEENVLLNLKVMWDHARKLNKNFSRAQFWEDHGKQAPGVTMDAFATFCSRENKKAGNTKQRKRV